MPFFEYFFLLFNFFGLSAGQSPRFGEMSRHASQPFPEHSSLSLSLSVL